MKPGHALAGLALCCLTIAAAFWAWPQPVGGDARTGQADARIPLDSSESRANISAGKPASSIAGSKLQRIAKNKPLAEAQPLPFFDVPFSDSFDALLEATQAGDSNAACRLVGEARRCLLASTMLKFQPVYEPPEASPAEENSSPGSTDQATLLEKRRERYELQITQRGLLEEAVSNCKGVDYSASAQSHYIVIAAEAGNVHSQLEYAQGRHLDIRSLLENPQLLDQYRVNARRYFESALHAGDLEVISALSIESALPDSGPLHQYLPEEWTEPGFVAALVSRMPEDHRALLFPSDTHVDIDVDQRARADAIYDRYFVTAEGGTVRQSLRGLRKSMDALQLTRYQLDEELDRCH